MKMILNFFNISLSFLTTRILKYPHVPPWFATVVVQGARYHNLISKQINYLMQSKELDYGKKWLSSIYLVSPRQLGDGGWDEKNLIKYFEIDFKS